MSRMGLALLLIIAACIWVFLYKKRHFICYDILFKKLADVPTMVDHVTSPVS